jgi:DNA-directed RNA polymerase subunit H (RpoH/RPB5)
MENIDIEIFRTIYYNTLDMLLNRKYDIKKYMNAKTFIELTNEDLIKKYKENNCEINLFENNKKIQVYFCTEKLGIVQIKELLTKLLEQKVEHIILITKNKLTSYAKKEMNNLGKNLEKEIFYTNEMTYNIIQHELVPKHELLTPEETKLMIKKFGKKIPNIKITDKMCRYYNGKIDQIFRIYRKNKLYYRIVIL